MTAGTESLLTLELLPLMIDSALTLGDGRIVFVSDADHCKGEFNPGNMNAEQSYARQKFYWHSKLYNVHKLISTTLISRDT